VVAEECVSKTCIMDGVAHEVVDGNLIYARCGARLPRNLRAASLCAEEPVTCLLCLGHVEHEDDEVDEEDRFDDEAFWGYGGVADEDGD
jgi:hypothetical protein